MPLGRFVALLLLCFTVGTGATENDTYTDYVEEDNTPQLEQQNLRWCHSPSLNNGEVTCRSPRGRAHRSMLGTRCEMSCDRGYRLVGSSSIQCLASRRWSGIAICRKKRCRVLELIPHGRYSCTHGFEVDTRCDYTCDRGYVIDGDHARICERSASWSGAQPICTDNEPPKVKCPRSRIKAADPGKLTAVVTWDPPVATDSADKSLEVTLVGQEPGTEFKEGPNIIKYRVYDQARNRAVCKFIVRVEVRRCVALFPPLHGYLTCSSDGNNYGATCEYHCDEGYEHQGASRRVCQFDGTWDGQPAECAPMEISADVKTVDALLQQFYAKRRLLIISAPNISDLEYQMQNMMIQKSECGLDLRRVTVVELLGSPPNETGRIKESQLDSEVIKGLRHIFRISRSYFSMLLLDERGLDRERFISPMSSEELYSVIDSFLLSEEEREKLELNQNLCE